MNDEAQITIRRVKRYADYLRAYKVEVDGIVVASVRTGQLATVPLAVGQHTLRLRIDWCGSGDLRFEARPGERIIFECGSSLTGWRILLTFIYVVFQTRQYLWLRRTT